MQQAVVAATTYPRGAARADISDTSHRRDIDGLRALAALSVVAVHTISRAVRGGQTGVDMFFVLSGYLISGIILRALVRGTFSFSDFYARRIRRIFPALLVVVFAVWVVGSVLLLPDEYRRLGKDFATSAVFSLHIFERFETDLPGNLDLGRNLLGQLWSLGVEEQFYLLWPLFLLCVYKFSKSKLSHVAIGMGTVALTSMTLLVEENRLPFGVALVPWRGLYELSLGGLLAVVQLSDFPLLRKLVARVKKIPLMGAGVTNANFLCLTAAALLVYAIISDPAKQLFPSSWTLAPTLGTLLLLLSGSQSIVEQPPFEPDIAA